MAQIKKLRGKDSENKDITIYPVTDSTAVQVASKLKLSDFINPDNSNSRITDLTLNIFNNKDTQFNIKRKYIYEQNFCRYRFFSRWTGP